MTGQGGDRERLALIRKACRYMDDDMAIAQIFAVLVPVVAAERAKLARSAGPVVVYKAAGVSDATYHIDTAARYAKACEGSRELLKRSIQYGLSHDSDLGMGYQPFMDRARELGLVMNHGEAENLASLGSPVLTSGGAA